MGVPQHLSSQADLSEVLQRLEHAHRCAGASAAADGKYDGILSGKRAYVDKQGEICGRDEHESILTRDGLFNCTVRSTACSQLVQQGSLRCSACKRLQKNQLESTFECSLAAGQPGQKVARARLDTETHQPAAKRVEQTKVDLRNSNKRENRLRKKVATLEAGFRAVGKATNDDLLQLFQDAQKSDKKTGVISLIICHAHMSSSCLEDACHHVPVELWLRMLIGHSWARFRSAA